MTDVTTAVGLGHRRGTSKCLVEMEAQDMTTPGLSLAAPPNRGRLLNAAEVADLIGGVSDAWVRRNVPHKVELGHSTVRWFKDDVLSWLESRRGQ